MAVYNTVQKVIDVVQTVFPNPFSDATLINWINEAVNENYLWIMERKSSTILTVEDQEEYDIPSDCRFDSIKKVKVDDRYYYPVIEDGYTSKGYYTYRRSDDDKLALYPIPSEDDLEIKLLYIQNPDEFTATTDPIPFIEATERVVIYYVCIEAAFAMQDDASSNNMTIKYNDALKAAKTKAMRGVKLSRTRDVTRRIGRGIK